jgi:hypothetical protein
VGHRQGAARQKIILKINEDERVHRLCVPCYDLVRLSAFIMGRGLR